MSRLHSTYADNLAVSGGEAYCERAVCTRARYNVRGVIDWYPELFRRPLHQPADLLIPLPRCLRELGLLLAALAGGPSSKRSLPTADLKRGISGLPHPPWRQDRQVLIYHRS